MVVEIRQAVADGLIAQELIGLNQVSIRTGELLDQSLGFRLLALDRRDVGDGFHDMGFSGCRLHLSPLHQEVFVVRKGNFTGRRLPCFDGFRHLAKGTGRRACGDFFMAGEIGNIAEFVLRHLVLEHHFVCQGVDDRDNHRLRVQQRLRVVLGALGWRCHSQLGLCQEQV